MKRLLAFLILSFVCASAHAVSISSSSAAMGGRPAIMLFPKETLTYTETGSFTGRIEIQKSVDGVNFIPLNISTTNNAGGTFTGTVYNDNTQALYRFFVTTVTAGSFISVIADNDDKTGQMVSLKQVPTLEFYDDSVRFGDLYLRSGKRSFGPPTVGFSTTTNAGLTSVGDYVTAYLSGNTAAVEGSLLVATTTVGGAFTVAVAPLTNNQTGWAGIARSAVSTGSVVDVYYSGFVLARTTGTVNPGDCLVSTSTGAGYMAGTATPTTGADVGVAINAGNTAGGLTLMRLR